MVTIEIATSKVINPQTRELVVVETEELKLFRYSELSDSAKKAAYDKWNSSDDWVFQEAFASVEKFAEVFEIKITNYSVGLYGQSYIDWKWSNINWDAPYSMMMIPDQHLPENAEEGWTGYLLYRYLMNFSEVWARPKKVFWLPSSKMRERWSIRNKTRDFSYRRHESTISFCTDGCSLTGTCYDLPLIEPLLDFCMRPVLHELHRHPDAPKTDVPVRSTESEWRRWHSTTLRDLIDEGIKNWISMYKGEMEYRESQEFFAEEAESRGMWFSEEGTPHKEYEGKNF